MRLRLTVDQGIAARAVSDDGGEQPVRIGHGLRCPSLSPHRGKRLNKVSIAEPAEYGAADRGAEGWQPIADLEAAGKNPCRAAAGDEQDVVAIEHGKRRD